MIHKVVAVGLLVWSLGGCAASYKHQLNFNPGEPIRIAVLPFIEVDEAGQIVPGDPNLLIDNVALVSSKLSQTPARFMQSLVQSELSSASLDVIPPGVVESMLLHSTFNIPQTKPLQIDVARVWQADPSELCSKALSCDAVLYGKVTDWDRSYYAIESVATVGVELRLVSARTKKVLFETQASDSDSRGLTKGPTGFSDLVVEPLSGLDNKIITDLAREVVNKALAPLAGRGRPEHINSPAPTILASAHSVRSGAMNRHEPLVVVMYGTPGGVGRFDVGEFVKGVPLVERSKGHYVGEYIPLAADAFSNAVISISLADQSGRVTTQRLANKPVTLQ